MKIKKIIKYIVIFVITLSILFGLLVATAKIPREAIKDNIRKTTEYFKTDRSTETKRIIKSLNSTSTHIYADSMLLNIIYCIDDQNALESVMEANYYSKSEDKQISNDFDKLMDKEYEGNVQYMRYWHGSMSIIRPLLVFFDINQIYVINAIVLAICAITLLIMLLKTKIKELVIAYIISLIMCMAFVVPFCLEFYWTFLIMFIASIVAIILEKKNKDLNVLFLLTGMLTCYFDFLSTETITVLIPIIFVLVIRYKEQRLNTFKEGIKFVVISGLFWTIGYVGMWAAKWILASIILNVNALDYVINDMMLRINGTGNEQIPISRISNLHSNAVKNNFFSLYPINYLITKKTLRNFILVVIILFELVIIEKKDRKKLWFSLLLLLIAIIPYIRYLVLASHSYTHYFFTFRAQMSSIIAILLSIVYSASDKMMNNQINLGSKK